MLYTFYQDPGHGWLEVPLSELQELKIVTQITPYSYQKNDKVYLEEDGDLTRFIEAKWPGASDEEVSRHIIPAPYNHGLRITNFNLYQPPGYRWHWDQASGEPGHWEPIPGFTPTTAAPRAAGESGPAGPGQSGSCRYK